MINQVLVDELVGDIQSGKKDLRECIEDYERQLDEEDGKLIVKEESYILEIEDLEETLEKQKDHIDRLDSKIDNFEDEIKELKHAISILTNGKEDDDYLIEELRVTISNKDKEIEKLEEENDKLKQYIQSAEGIIV